MPPPPMTARLLRARPITPALVGAWVSRDIEHCAAAKIQNHRIIAVLTHIHSLAKHADRLKNDLRANHLQALDALTRNDVDAAKRCLTRGSGLLDALEVTDQAIAEAADLGIAIEQEDVQREAARGVENGHKVARLQEARRAEKPQGPGGAA